MERKTKRPNAKEFDIDKLLELQHVHPELIKDTTPIERELYSDDCDIDEDFEKNLEEDYAKSTYQYRETCFNCGEKSHISQLEESINGERYYCAFNTACRNALDLYNEKH